MKSLLSIWVCIKYQYKNILTKTISKRLGVSIIPLLITLPTSCSTCIFNIENFLRDSYQLKKLLFNCDDTCHRQLPSGHLRRKTCRNKFNNILYYITEGINKCQWTPSFWSWVNFKYSRTSVLISFWHMITKTLGVYFCESIWSPRIFFCIKYSCGFGYSKYCCKLWRRNRLPRKFGYRCQRPQEWLKLSQTKVTIVNKMNNILNYFCELFASLSIYVFNLCYKWISWMAPSVYTSSNPVHSVSFRDNLS